MLLSNTLHPEEGLFFCMNHASDLKLTDFSTAGFFHSITGAIHSVVGELSDETNQSTAFPLYDIVSALGFVIGSAIAPLPAYPCRCTNAIRSPLIGGTFADPAKEWPDVFTNPLWKTYPYLLPCLITTGVSTVAALLSVFALHEVCIAAYTPPRCPHLGPGQTLPGKRKNKSPVLEEEPLLGPESSATVIDVPPTLEDLQPLSVRHLLSIPVLRAVIASSGALGLAGSCFTNIFVLMAYTPIRQGGLAFSVRALSSRRLLAPFPRSPITLLTCACRSPTARTDRTRDLEHGRGVDPAQALHAEAPAALRHARHVRLRHARLDGDVRRHAPRVARRAERGHRGRPAPARHVDARVGRGRGPALPLALGVSCVLVRSSVFGVFTGRC